MKASKINKQKSRQILATLVMGMNFVNTMAPMAMAMQKLPESSELPAPTPKSEAKPLEYTVLPQTLNFVEEIVFSKAEAADRYVVSAGQDISVSGLYVLGDEMSVLSGGTGTISTMQAGSQCISSGASGTVSNMSSGYQIVSNGGSALIRNMSGGFQDIYDEATGSVYVMYSGVQLVSGGTGDVDRMIGGGAQVISGGTGTVDFMQGGGHQTISGGTGIVSSMSGGSQKVYSGGRGEVHIIEAGGSQVIGNGGIGTVDTIMNGDQVISSGGTGNISILWNGAQIVSGTGSVGTMSNGRQVIYSGGIGIVYSMSGGTQFIGIGGTGTVDTMRNGSQTISSGGTGIVSTMISANASQVISGGANGTVYVMSNGKQTIISGGTGTVYTMNSGMQSVSSGGTGATNVMNGGRQQIDSGAIGTITTMNSNGYQIIGNHASGTIGTMNGGSQYIGYYATGIVNVMNDGSQSVSRGGSGAVADMSDGEQTILTGGTGTISAMAGGTQYISSGGTSVDTTINGGTQVIYDIGTAKNTTINSGMAAMLGAGAVVEDLTMTGGEYLLGADGGTYNIGGTFNFTGGNFDMTKDLTGSTPGSYETLTIDNLQSGGGTFIMDTDLASETNGDKIRVTHANGGTTYIQVNDTSLLNGAINGNKNLLLVTVDNGTAVFAGKDLNNGGIWTATPAIENGVNVKDAAGNVIGTANQWYLTHVIREVNNDTEVLLEGSDNGYALWRNTNDTLRKRLGELHYRNNKIDGDGIWARYIGGKFNSGNYDGNYNMYQLGYDKADNAKSTYGIALEKGSGHADYSFGNGKDELFAGSFYGTWTGDDGSYTDVVAKIGQFDSDIRSYGDYPDKAEYKNRAYSLSVEYGKNINLNEKSGTFIEPQIQFIAGRLDSSSYTTDRGNNVYLSGVNSYLGRLGFVLGQKITDGDVYFKASVLREFGGDRDVHMTAANGESLSRREDYSDTWFELGIGTNIKLSKISHFYADIERSFGADIEKKWQINAGLRFEF